MLSFVTIFDSAVQKDRTFALVEQGRDAWVVSTLDGGENVSLHHEGGRAYVRRCFENISLSGIRPPIKWDRVLFGAPYNPFLLTKIGF